ncbi:Pyridoxal kinase PdxY [Gammaproteobacteria bacterium]
MFKSVLSIQSHVAYGYVGNKAATFPLQSMGYDVWPVNTVQFSNHTGYGKWQGTIFESAHIRNVIQGIEDLGVTDKCVAILSGYMGSSEICHEVLATVKRFKSRNANILYLCDPVIGNTSCFVKPEVLHFFKDYLRADIITPNQFEAETLSGITIKNVQDLKNAADYFHKLNVKIVIITGVKVQDLGNNELYVFIACEQKYTVIKTKEHNFVTPPNGSGDLFSALFLGSYLATNDGIESLRRTIYFMELVMNNTFQAGSRELLVTSVNYSSFDQQSLFECTAL